MRVEWFVRQVPGDEGKMVSLGRSFVMRVRSLDGYGTGPK